MSASIDASAIFMNDSPKKIKDKINKYAFSGGQVSAEDQRRLGGNPDVDVSYQYLNFFMEDDAVSFRHWSIGKALAYNVTGAGENRRGLPQGRVADRRGKPTITLFSVT